VGERDLARVGLVAPAHQPGMADGVMRGAERPVLDQGRIRGKLVGHRVNAGDVQGLVDGHARQDARHGARQQGFASPGRTDLINTFGTKDSCI
jgi:hypothetical protein